MNDKCKNLLNAFLLLTIGCILSNPAAVSARDVPDLPCYTVEEAPEYLHAFMNWAVLQDEREAVEIKWDSKKDDFLAVVTFQSFSIKSLYGQLRGQNVGYITGLVDGTLKIAGSCQRPVFTGALSISGGYVQLSNFGEQALQQVSIDSAEVESFINRFDSLKVDLNIVIGDDYYLRNRRFLPMKIKLQGTLHLTKQINRNSQLTGKLQVKGGYVKPLGTRFRIVGGLLTFSGEVDNPQISLSSLYIPHRDEQDIKIWYYIEGTIEDPSFKFRSKPPMELKNIFSFTLFGQPFYRLDSVEQGLVSSIAGRSAIDRTADVLVNRVEAIATQTLSVDVVRIDNTTAESGTVITTGWYLNPRVFFAIQNVIAGTPKIGFYLEYYLTENLKLILSQDNDYGQGIDLQYEYNY